MYSSSYHVVMILGHCHGTFWFESWSMFLNKNFPEEAANDPIIK